MDEQNIETLKQEAMSLGLPEVAVNNMDAATLATTIAGLKAVKVSQPQPTIEPVVNAAEEQEIAKSHQTKADRQRALYEQSPKVRILVPLEGQEKVGVVDWRPNPRTGRMEQVHVSGAVQPTTENGYTYLVPKGVYTDVPEPVARLIQDKLQQTTEAGQNLLLDRVDPQTGRPVRDQL